MKRKVVYEIQIEYGSKSQESFGEGILQGFLLIFADRMYKNHKKNKVVWKALKVETNKQSSTKASEH